MSKFVYMKTKHSFQYWQWRVILSSMIGYSIFYFVRKNFAFAMPSLGAEYGIADTKFGIILTLGGILYGVSKLVNGMIADRANARWHFAIGLSLTVLINFLFGWSADLSHWIIGVDDGPDFVNGMFAAVAALYLLNNIAQGSGVAPCNRLLVHWIPPKELATKLSIWNTAHSVGGALVSILCGAIIGSMGANMSSDASVVAKIAGNMGKDVSDQAVVAAASHVGAWQWCFWIPAFIGIAGIIFMWFAVRDTPKSVGLEELPDTKTEMDDNDTKEGYRKFVRKMVFRNPIVWTLAIADIFVYVVRFAVFDWGPKFLTQGSQALSPQLAGWTIAIFEICGIVGMLAAGYLTDHLFKSKGWRLSAIWMVLMAICLLAIWLLPANSNKAYMLILLGLTGFFLYGPQTLMGVSAANQATKKAASAAVGFVGMVSYMANLITGVGFGLMSDHFHDAFWDNLFIIMAGFAIAGAILLFFLWNIKDDGYIHEEDAAAEKKA